MKKIFSILVALTAVLSLTGCGSKTVTCTINEDDEKEVMSVTYKGKEITKIAREMTMKAEEDEIDEAYSYLKLASSMFEGKSGLKVSTSKGSDFVSMKMEIELSKLDEEMLETLDFDLDDAPSTPEEFIKEMTEDGYTCK